MSTCTSKHSVCVILCMCECVGVCTQYVYMHSTRKHCLRLIMHWECVCASLWDRECVCLWGLCVCLHTDVSIVYAVYQWVHLLCVPRMCVVCCTYSVRYMFCACLCVYVCERLWMRWQYRDNLVWWSLSVCQYMRLIGPAPGPSIQNKFTEIFSPKIICLFRVGVVFTTSSTAANMGVHCALCTVHCVHCTLQCKQHTYDCGYMSASFCKSA